MEGEGSTSPERVSGNVVDALLHRAPIPYLLDHNGKRLIGRPSSGRNKILLVIAIL
jgi:hypothetical protein